MPSTYHAAGRVTAGHAILDRMASTAPERSVRRRGRSRTRAQDGREPVPREAWTRLAACTAAAALLQLDGTVITVALPTVARNLHIANSATALILSAYFAAYALLLWPGGRLVDRFGARWVALLGLGVFAVGAALGAIVSSLGLLCATRVLQGIGAGLVSPAALAGAVSGFPAARRGAALGIWGASAGMANLIGPLLGGVLTVTLGWRAAWWALVPLALIAALGVVRHVPRLVHEVGVEGRARVLNKTVASATGVAGLTFAVMIGTFYLAEQYLQKTVGYSALGASAVLVVVALLVGAAAPLAGGLVDRRGERLPTMLGFGGAALGMAILAIPGVSLHGIGTAFALIPIGLGLGMLFVPVSRAALNATPAASHGRASALLSEARLLGAAIGAGLAGAAVAGGPSASTVHAALAVAAGACLLLGVPLAAQFGSAA
jgi:MFS family permease